MCSFKVTAIVPAAGKGVRFGGTVKKPFAKLNGKALLWYCLKTLQSSPLIKDIVLVVDGSVLKKTESFVKRHAVKKVKYIVRGGGTRTESVRNGLRRVEESSSLVMIHDGVRPFVNREMVRKTVIAASKFKASVLAVPVQSTIKVSDSASFIKYTPQRKNLWEAQTPQVFDKKLLEKAYKKVKNAFETREVKLVVAEKFFWKRKPVEDLLTNSLIHALDSINWFCGEPQSVSAQAVYGEGKNPNILS